MPSAGIFPWAPHRKHSPLWPAIALFLTVAGWVATAGSGIFLGPSSALLSGTQADSDPLHQFYDAQGQSILAGRLDVPCRTIDREAFIHAGRCYGYFGMTPSLFRIPLNFFFPEYFGQWEALSLLLAGTLTLIFAYLLLLALQRYSSPQIDIQDRRYREWTLFFLLALGPGSTTLFLMSRTVVYHEAVIWSGALAIGCFYLLIRFLEDRRLRWITAAGLAALLAIHCRILAGLAAATACGLVPLLDFLSGEIAPPVEKRFSFRLLFRQKAILLGWVAAVTAVSSHYAIAYAKFGCFETAPIRFHLLYTPNRLALIDGSMIHGSNLIWNADNYFGWHWYDFGSPASSSPTVGLGQLSLIEEARRNYPSAKIDDIEGFLSLPVGMSALLVFSLLGLKHVLKNGRHRPVLTGLILSSLIGPLGLLFFAYMSYRYLHEYILFFSLAGGLGVLRLGAERNRTPLRYLLLFLIIGNITLNLLFSIQHQINDTNLGPAIPQMLEKVKTFAALIQIFPSTE